MNLAAVDLNLLIALDALLKEGNVTRAGERVGLSQSAMSHALGRLRELFDDPLLVRAGRSMVLTPRAAGLCEPLDRVLEDLRRVIEPPVPFDPLSSEETFALATNDYAQFVLLPGLMERLSKVAPGVNIRVRELGIQKPETLLESGEIDLALTLGLPENISEKLYSEDLFMLELVCLVRADHPEVDDALSLEQYAGLSHVLISPKGDDTGVVDWTLGEIGMARRVAAVVPHFMVAPYVVAQTDLILTTAKSVAEAFARHLPIKLLEPPLELTRGTVSMVWHERTHDDAARVWLRGLLGEVNAAVQP